MLHLNKTAYRITVRQLESIIRLSEAIARVHADDEVRGEYVHEASRLLSKSIIPIKNDDIEVEDAQQEFNRIQRTRQEQRSLITPEDLNQNNMEVDGDASAGKTQLSFQEYQQIGKKLLYILKKKQDELGDDFEGYQQKDLIGDFLKDIENQITGTDKLIEWAKKLARIIQRLISKEGMICVLEGSASVDERALMVNVNIDPGNMEIGQ